ncbi:putative membrane-anchored protein [Branchiibius hedensis]|uniref:Uncharacterized membrane-anchored protein n=1 Tax=Branchiibius hedensis TaxID=672460 RepID=A0A2Y8ZT49_9MICO|nr:hypothetical protein [Branchiibius hedensis]PWJ26760.1 putative membrane-anchored protein [Branchiibius hedensis]SSA35571.1 Uncharacterized membrane-anchored protein [Branchiibius hedensis]
MSGPLIKVPTIDRDFWILKLLTTAGGEALSDYLAGRSVVLAGVVGVLLLVLGGALQLRTRSYQPVPYWLFAAAIAVFGTMLADGMHVVLGVPYPVTSTVYAAALALVFLLWHRATGTIDIHTVTAGRPEVYYWCAVGAAFALGTALGDFAAFSLGLGYLASAVLFGVLFAATLLLHHRARWGVTVTFWSAYVLTRPFGASVADYLGKPAGHGGGRGWGDGLVALGLFAAFTLMLIRVANRYEGVAHLVSSSDESV